MDNSFFVTDDDSLRRPLPKPRIGINSKTGVAPSLANVIAITGSTEAINWTVVQSLDANGFTAVIDQHGDESHLVLPASAPETQHVLTLKLLGGQKTVENSLLLPILLASAFVPSLFSPSWSDVVRIARTGHSGVVAGVVGDTNEALDEARDLISTSIDRGSPPHALCGAMAVLSVAKEPGLRHGMLAMNALLGLCRHGVPTSIAVQYAEGREPWVVMMVIASDGLLAGEAD